MSPTDPEFIYFILALPALFGIALVGDGINKIIHDENGGYISLIFGLIFFAVVVLAYFFFSTYLVKT